MNRKAVRQAADHADTVERWTGTVLGLPSGSDGAPIGSGLLGVGGQGFVSKAMDLVLDRLVAIKVLFSVIWITAEAVSAPNLRPRPRLHPVHVLLRRDWEPAWLLPYRKRASSTTFRPVTDPNSATPTTWGAVSHRLLGDLDQR